MRFSRADERVSESEVSEHPAEFGEQQETYGGGSGRCVRAKKDNPTVVHLPVVWRRESCRQPSSPAAAVLGCDGSTL